MRKPMTSTLTLLTSALLLSACTAEAPTPAPDRAADRTDLRAALGVSSLTPTGVTIEPGTGRVLVLDADRGIFEVTPDGQANLVWGLERLEAYGVPVASPFTDLVAVEAGVIALTAISDGFLLDLGADSFEQHFCYEPGWEEEPPPFEERAIQVTDAVAFDAHTGRILAQPRTIVGDDFGAPVEAFVSTYDRSSGADIQWFSLPSADFKAGGMAIEPEGTVLLGQGSALYRHDPTEGTLTLIQDLSPWGIRAIEGMALDAERGALLIIDGDTEALVRISMAEIGG